MSWSKPRNFLSFNIFFIQRIFFILHWSFEHRSVEQLAYFLKWKKGVVFLFLSLRRISNLSDSCLSLMLFVMCHNMRPANMKTFSVFATNIQSYFRLKYFFLLSVFYCFLFYFLPVVAKRCMRTCLKKDKKNENRQIDKGTGNETTVSFHFLSTLEPSLAPTPTPHPGDCVLPICARLWNISAMQYSAGLSQAFSIRRV